MRDICQRHGGKLSKEVGKRDGKAWKIIKTHKKRAVKQSKMQQNAQKDEKFSKRVFTKLVLCGKLWENFIYNKLRMRFGNKQEVR